MPGEVARAEEAGPLRDQEGLVVGLYRHLWLKNQKGETCNVNIPHTVIFQNQEPVAWYFTSFKENKVMRKKKPSLGPVMAEAFMASRATQPEVCAWFTGNMTTTESQVLKTRSRTRDIQEEEVEVVLQARAMEHLTYDRVQLMLDPGPYRLVSEEHVYDGIMQKFLEPRNPNDFIIRAIWSPSACIFEKRTNKHRLLPRPDLGPHEEIPPLVDRIASFNSSMWLHEHAHISTKALKTQLLAQCDAVAHHLKDVTKGQASVSRMELFFKIDTQHRIWLLFCNSLQLERHPLGDPRYPRISQQGEAAQGPASFVLKDPTQPKEEQANEEEQGNCLCAMTGKIFPRRERVHVTYKLIMQHWFKRCSELASESDRIAALDSIPPAIRRSNPNMSREFYLRCRSQPFFMLNIADVSPDADEDLLRAAYDELAESLGHPVGLRCSTRGGKRAAAARPLPDAGGRTRPQSRQGAPAAPGLRVQSPDAHSSEMGLPSALLPKGDSRPPSRSSLPSAQSAWTTWRPQQLPSSLYQRPAPASASRRSFSRAMSARESGSDPGTTWPPSSAAPPWQALPPAPAPAAPRPATALGTIAEEASLRMARPPGDARGALLRYAYLEYRVPPPPRPPQYRVPPPPAPEPEPSGSVRSSQSLLNTAELKTLQEISDAYSQAERLTQQLLSQAHQLLQSPQGEPSASPSSRPAYAAAATAGGGPDLASPARAADEDMESDWTISLTGSRRSSGEALPVASETPTPQYTPARRPPPPASSQGGGPTCPSSPETVSTISNLPTPYCTPLKGPAPLTSNLSSPYTSPGGTICTVSNLPTPYCTPLKGAAPLDTAYSTPASSVPTTAYSTPAKRMPPPPRSNAKSSPATSD